MATKKRTCGDVLAWYAKNGITAKAKDGRAEIIRLVNRFAAFQTADGRVVGECDIDDVCGGDLVEWINSGGAMSGWTRRRWCVTLKTAMLRAQRYGLIKSTPFAGVSEPGGSRGRDLTPQEFAALLRNSCPAIRRLLIALRFTGARPGELAGAGWEDVDWKERRIVLAKHKTSGKTAKPRIIYLSPVIYKLLLWLKRTGTHKRNIFTNTFGGVWRTHAWCKYIRATRKKLGLPDSVKAYGCRHSFCTSALVDKGLDLATVAELAGHSNILTTQGYVHLKPGHLKAAMEQAAPTSAKPAPPVAPPPAAPPPAAPPPSPLDLAALITPEAAKEMLLGLLRRSL